MKRYSFLKNMLSGANGRISSKRVLGAFILIVLLTVIVICIFTGYEGTWLGEAVITMMIGAFSLLGIGVLEKRYQDYGKDGQEREQDRYPEEEGEA